MTEDSQQGQKKAALFVLVAVCLCLTMSSCIDEDKACGDNMTLVKTDLFGEMCVLKTVDTGTGTESADSQSDVDSDAGTTSDTEGANMPAGMGDPCTVHEDCTKAADYCATPPGSAGLCTVTGCVAGATESCPSGFDCFNLTAIIPTEPTICVPEE